MYLFERVMWSGRVESPEQRQLWEEEIAKTEGNPPTQKLKTSQSRDDVWEYYDLACDLPTDAQSLYVFNEDYIDVRAAFQEEKRGLITFGFLSMAVIMNLYMFDFAFLSFGRLVVFGSDYYDAWEFESIISWLLSMATWGVMNYYLWKYTWRWIRVELFTQRHLIARFNRKTRQVYVNRPDYAGGIVTLPWEAVIPAINPEDPDFMGIGGFLLLAFMSEHTGAGYDEVLMLGRPMHGNDELGSVRKVLSQAPHSAGQ